MSDIELKQEQPKKTRGRPKKKDNLSLKVTTAPSKDIVSNFHKVSFKDIPKGDEFGNNYNSIEKVNERLNADEDYNQYKAYQDQLKQDQFKRNGKALFALIYFTFSYLLSSSLAHSFNIREWSTRIIIFFGCLILILLLIVLASVWDKEKNKKDKKQIDFINNELKKK